MTSHHFIICYLDWCRNHEVECMYQLQRLIRRSLRWIKVQFNARRNKQPLHNSVGNHWNTRTKQQLQKHVPLSRLVPWYHMGTTADQGVHSELIIITMWWDQILFQWSTVSRFTRYNFVECDMFPTGLKTRVFSCESSLKLIWDCRERHEECRGLIKQVLKPYDNCSQRLFYIMGIACDFFMTRILHKNCRRQS